MSSQGDTTIEGLPNVVARALEAPGWRAHLGSIDAEMINNLEALATLPILHKSDLPQLQRSQPPFGGFESRTVSELSRLFLSPGPIFEPEPVGDDPWGAAASLADAGLRPGDVVLNTFSYHLTPGGFLFDSGARSLGCAVIPAGPGNTEQQLELISAYAPNVFIGTPDFLNLLLKAAQDSQVDTSCVRTAILSGAAFPASLREKFRTHGIQAHEIYAAAEVGIIASGSPDSDGLTVSRDLVVEIVDPATGRLAAPGQVGEVVVTCLRPQRPLLRLALGDLSSLIIDGSSERPRLRGWQGRVDQATKIKGMFVRPEQMREIQRRHPEIQRLRLVVQRAGEADIMTLHAEAAPSAAISSEKLTVTLTAVTKLRGAVKIHPVGALPDDGKVIADER
jgi:phenylacetate-CoA ligase